MFNVQISDPFTEDCLLKLYTSEFLVMEWTELTWRPQIGILKAHGEHI